MWKCSQCDSEVEDTLSACWNCGTAADGGADPTFSAEIDSDDLPPDGVRRIQCPTCGYRGKVLIRHAGYSFWMLPVSLGASVIVNLLGLPWYFSLFVFGLLLMILGNRTTNTCPKCDLRTGLRSIRGEGTPESEAIWNSAQLADDQRFAANKLKMLVGVLLVLAFVLVNLYFVSLRT